MIDYINGNNYYGTKYHKYRDEQIEATKFWKETFYPINQKIFNEKKEYMETLIKKTLTENS